MINYTKEEAKTVEKYKRRVHKQYPGAFLTQIKKGYFSIVQEKDDFSVVDVLEEQLMPPQISPILAWETAQLSCRISQNLNRTHPMRSEGRSMADKIAKKIKPEFNSRNSND